MNFIPPTDFGVTIYGKAGCPECKLALNLVPDAQYINCDEYLIYNRDELLNIFKFNYQAEVKKFPIVFINKRYVGSYKELKQILHDEEKKDY